MDFNQNFSLKAYNSLKLESTANFFCEVYSKKDCFEALNFANDNKLEVLIIGSGTNIIFPQKLNSLVIKNNLKGIDRKKNKLSIASGENWHDLVLWSLRNYMYGLENLALIPGTVGAGPIQNIGAYGEEISSKLTSVDVIDMKTLSEKTISQKECKFGYRDSLFKLNKNLMITRVHMELKLKDQPNTSYENLSRFLIDDNIRPSSATAMQVCRAVIALRSKYLPDPKIVPNVGSFFKNPYIDENQLASLLAIDKNIPNYKENNDLHKISAAYLIEQTGWKGIKKGQVGIHANHSLILITYDGATREEILEFAGNIKTSVKNKFNLYLEIEPTIFY